MVEIIAQPGRQGGPPKTKAPVEIESLPEPADTEVEGTLTTPIKVSDAALQGATDEELSTLTSQMVEGSELKGRVSSEAESRGLPADLDDTEPTPVDTEVDEIVLGSRTLSEFGGDGDALSAVQFDRVEVERTSTVKRTIGYLNGESTIISEEPIDPSQMNIEQRVEDGVSYDVEMREDGSEHLRGRTGDPSSGQETVMLRPPNRHGETRGAEGFEDDLDDEDDLPPEEPPGRFSDEPTPPAEGPLRPTGEMVVSANRKVFLDEHGREQIEQLLTVQDDRINGGRPTNIPTIWDGVALREEDAIQAAMASRQSFESFRSTDEAAEGIVQREAQIQRERAFVDFMSPVVDGIGRGLQNVAHGIDKGNREMLSLVPWFADAADWLDNNFPFLVIPYEPPTTEGGETLSMAAQVMAPMIGFARMFSFLGVFWKWTAAGGVAEFTALSPDEELLFPGLLEAMGELDTESFEQVRQILLDGLKKDADDSETIKRLKNMIEGVGLGLVIDGLIRAFPIIKRMNMPGPFGTVGKAIATAAATTMALALSSDSAEASMAKRILDALSAMGHEPAGPFFSVLMKRLKESRQGSATGEQWMAMIDNMSEKGVKKEERFWAGVDDFLEENKFSRVTRLELIEYLQNNKVEIEEVTLGPGFGQTEAQAELMVREAEEANRVAANAQLDADPTAPRHQFGTPAEQAAARERLSDAQQALGATTNADPTREALVQEFEQAQEAMRDIVPGWGRAAGSLADAPARPEPQTGTNIGAVGLTRSPVLQEMAADHPDAFREVMREGYVPRVDEDRNTLRFGIEDEDGFSDMVTTRELVDGIASGEFGAAPGAALDSARASAIELQHAFDRIHGMELTGPPVPPRTSAVHERTYRPTEQGEGNLVLGGGSDYRELLITLPRNKEVQWNVWDTEAPEGAEVVRTFATRKAAREFVEQSENKNLMLGEKQVSEAEAYTGGHFDDENVLVHVRTTDYIDVNGKRVLLIEEFQSDWFQAARKLRTKRVKQIAKEQNIPLEEANQQVPRNYGFKTAETTGDIRAAHKKSNEAHQAMSEARERFQEVGRGPAEDPVRQGPFTATSARAIYLNAPIGTPPTGQFGDISDLMGGSQPKSAVEEAWVVQNHLSQLEDAASLTTQRYDALTELQHNALPDAPFKASWSRLALRRMVRLAAENDYDAVAWTTGKQQVERYKSGLRDLVDTIQWKKNNKGEIQLIGLKGGSERVNMSYKEGLLSDAIGDSMAKRILDDPSQTGSITGDNITIDDIGMAGFYDRMMVNYGNDFGDKFGSKVGKTSIKTRDRLTVKSVSVEKVNEAAGAARDAGDIEAADALDRVSTNLEGGMRSRNAFDPVTEEQLDKYLPEAIEKRTKETVHMMEVTDSMRETALSEGFPLFNLAAGTGATAAAAAAAGGTARPAEARSTAGQGGFLPGADDVDLGGSAGNDQLTAEGPLPGEGVDRGAFGQPSVAAGEGQQVAMAAAVKRFLQSVFSGPDPNPIFRSLIKVVKGRVESGKPIVDTKKATYTARKAARADNKFKVGPKKGQVKGVPVNENRVLAAPPGSGKPDFPIGTPTWKQKQAFIEHMLTPAERIEARNWYSSVLGVFEDAFGPEEGQVRMISWMLANQNVSPTQALQNVLKITEEITDVGSRGGQVGVKISQGGLSHDAVGDFLRGKKVEKGLGQKLLDFVDSGLGRDRRSFYGNDPSAGAPYTADTHAIRGGGMVDQTALTSLERQGYDTTGVELDFKGGAGQTSPDVHQYEHIGNWGRRMTEEANAQGFMGGNLTPAELQAIDWMAMTKFIGDAGQTPQQAIDNNIIRVMFEARPATGSRLNDMFGAELNGLDRTGQISVNAAVTRRAAEIVGEELGADIRALYHGTGGWTNKGVVEVSPSTVAELLASPAKADAVADGLALLSDQKEIWTAMAKPKRSKKPQNAAIHIVEVGSTKLASDAEIAKVWLAIQEADPTKIIGGWAPLVNPDGSVGMTILIRARELEGKGPGELKSRTEDLKRLIEGDVLAILEKALKKFDMKLDVDIEEVGINVRRNDFETKGKENGADHIQRLEDAGRGQAANRIVSRRGELEAVYRKSIDDAQVLQRRKPKTGGGGEGPRPSEVSLLVQQKVLDQERINGTLKPDDPRLEAGEYDAMSKRLGLLTTGAVVASAAGFSATGEAEASTPGQPESQETGVPMPPNLDPRLAGFWDKVFSPFIGRAGRERLRNTPESFESRMRKQPPDPGVVEATERSWDEYREVDRDLFGDPVRTKGIDFNLDRMNTNDDVNQQINNVSRLYAREIKETTGGVIPLKVTRQVADLIGAEPEAAARAVQSLPSDVSDLHVRALVMRDMMVEAANDVDRRAIAMGSDPSQVSDAEALAFREAHAKFVLLARQMKGVQTDIARGLSAFRVEADDFGNVMRRAAATQELLNAQGGRSVALDLASRWLKTPNDKKAKLNPSIFAKVRSSVFEIWINGLLSSTRTHMVNFVGNNLFTIWQVPERVVAGALGAARQVLPNSNPDRVFMREGAALLHGYFESIPAAGKLAWETWKSGKPSTGLSKVENISREGISAQAWGVDASSMLGRFADVFGAFVRLPGRALMTADEFNRALGHGAERRTQAFRRAQIILDGGGDTKTAAEAYADVMGGKIPDVESEIADFGDLVTFTKQLGDGGQKIQAMIARFPILKLVVPFFRTPTNLFKEFVKRTPMAPALKEVRKDWLAGGAKRDLALARMSTGIAAFFLGTNLSAQGIITGGGPTDRRMRTVWLRSHQPYSIRFPGSDEWIPYGRAEPLATLLGVVADFAEYQKWAPADVEDAEIDHVVIQALGSVMHTVSQKTFLLGISELAAAYSDPDRYAGDFVRRITGSASPYSSFLRDVETAVDRPRRDSRSDPRDTNTRRAFDEALNQLKERTAGFSEDLPQRLNFWGEEILAFDGEWYHAFNAFRPRKMKNNVVDDEMLRLRYPLTKPRGEIDGVELTPQQNHDFIKAYNDIKLPNPSDGDKRMNMRETLEWQVTKSKAYKRSRSDEARMALLRRTRDIFVKVARDEMKNPRSKHFDADLSQRVNVLKNSQRGR